MDNIVFVFFHLAGLACLLSLSAFFSGSETALFSLSRTQVESLRQGRAKSGAIAAKLLDNPRRLLITILVGNMFVNTASASLIASLAAFLMGNKGVSVAIVVSTILILIFGEITPKTIAVHNAEHISTLVAYPLQFFSRVIFPLRRLLRLVTDLLMRLMGGGSVPVEDRFTTEELKAMVEVAQEGGSIKEYEEVMLNTIFDLRNITAAEIMVPWTDMICVSEDSTLQQVLDLARAVRRSRIPVYKNDVDHISNIIHIRDFPVWRHHDIYGLTIKDFLRKSQKLLPGGKNALIRPPLFVPETRTALDLLQDFDKQGVRMAILLDEYGGTAGLVTLEDLIEELVGDIDKEYDTSSEDFQVLDANTTVVSGNTSIRNVNRKLGLSLLAGEDEDIDTIGGYILHILGRIPGAGETFSADALEFEVVEMDKQRITKVAIRKPEADVKELE